MRTRRTVAGRVLMGAVVVGASALALAGCVFPSESTPGAPTDVNQYSTEGFPPPGPAPVPGQITPGPVAPPQPADEPRPEFGPVPTEGPQTSEPEGPVPTGAPAPAPGS